MRKSKILRSAALLAAVVILGAAALSAGGVDAAKGGSHGGGQTGSGACSVTPNPVPANSTYVISGSGFAGQYIIVYAGATVFIPTVNADGTFTISTFTGAPGDYTVWVEARTGTKEVLVATCYFQISNP